MSHPWTDLQIAQAQERNKERRRRADQEAFERRHRHWLVLGGVGIIAVCMTLAVVFS